MTFALRFGRLRSQRFLADAVGAVAAVTRQTDLLIQHRDSIRHTHGCCNHEFRAVWFAALGIAILVKVHEDGGSGQRGWFIDAAVKLTGSGGDLPVNALESIAENILPNAGGSGRVFKEPVLETNLSDGPFRSEVVLREGNDFGIDHHIHRLANNAVSAMQAEHIAGFE